jgi:hypothetical protein
MEKRVTQEHIDRLFDQSVEQEYELWGKEYYLSIKLPNGFVVDGRGVCVSPKNYDREIGRRVAVEQIKNKLWELEGYLLQDKLFNISNERCERLPDVGDIYRHYKGNVYKIVPVPCDAYTGQPILSVNDKSVEGLIWYQSESTDIVWCRTLNEFMDYVLHKGERVRRFEFIK